MVNVDVVNRSGIAFDADPAVALAREVLSAEGIEDGDLGLLLVAPDEIRELKREHLGVDEPTDALAFPIDRRELLPRGIPRQLGDVVMCPEVVGKEWRGPLVHPVLPLICYEHGEPIETRERAPAQ